MLSDSLFPQPLLILTINKIVIIIEENTTLKEYLSQIREYLSRM